MIEPGISNYGENYFFHFFVTSNSDFVLTKFCMSICKDVLLMKLCNLHDLYSCIDSNECFMLSWTFHFFEIQGIIIILNITKIADFHNFGHKKVMEKS